MDCIELALNNSKLALFLWLGVFFKDYESSKRKSVVLSLNDKIEIINQSNKGMSGKHLAKRFGVGNSTIFDTRTNSIKILNFESSLESDDGSSSRKVMEESKKRRT